MKYKSIGLVFALAAIALSLSACGGGSKQASAPPDGDGDRIVDASDCAPNDAARWQLLNYAAIDGDGDSRQIVVSGQVCSGNSRPPGFYAERNSDPVDCDDGDGAKTQLLPYAALDLDNDGRKIQAAGEVCSGATLPPRYFASAAGIAPVDCNDNDPIVWRVAATYVDQDGDGVGSGRATNQCIGLAATAGRSLYGYDPVDDLSVPNSANITASSDLHVTRSVIR